MWINYFTHLLVLIGIYVILATSLNLTLGFSGFLNLGHIAFFGVGAYTSALLTKAGVPYIWAFLCAGLLAAVAGFILMTIVQRLKGDFLAMAALTFVFVVYSVLLNWTSFTRGALGIPGIAHPSLFGYVIHTQTQYLVFTWIVAVIVIFLIYLMTHSRFGKLLEGVRDDQVGLAAFGKPVPRIKYYSMTISALFAGFAGSVFAHYLSYIDPSTFFINDIVILFTIVKVGGLASTKGSVVATFLILLLPELLRFLPIPASMIGPLRQVFYSLVLIGILMWRPRGLFGKVSLS